MVVLRHQMFKKRNWKQWRIVFSEIRPESNIRDVNTSTASVISVPESEYSSFFASSFLNYSQCIIFELKISYSCQIIVRFIYFFICAKTYILRKFMCLCGDLVGAWIGHFVHYFHVCVMIWKFFNFFHFTRYDAPAFI